MIFSIDDKKLETRCLVTRSKQIPKNISLHNVKITITTLFSKITIFNKSSQGAFADQDPTALDFSVNVKLGKLRFVFLGYFMAHLQV